MIYLLPDTQLVVAGFYADQNNVTPDSDAIKDTAAHFNPHSHMDELEHLVNMNGFESPRYFESNSAR